MQLSTHFSLEELIASETAARQHIDNTPPESLAANLEALAQGLEKVRTLLGNRPIHINSGYRCEKLNEAVGGAKYSAHRLGLAADIICPAFGSPLKICEAIRDSTLPFTQLIHEFGQWCHIEFVAPVPTGTTPSNPKREVLTIKSAKTGYQKGLS